jgi:hypothetical protein
VISLSPAAVSRYRTTRDILVPKGTNVVYISQQKQHTYRLAQALIRFSEDMIYEWQMNFDDALRAGLIEKIE